MPRTIAEKTESYIEDKEERVENHPAYLRRGELSVEDLESFAVDLAACVAKIRANIQQMNDRHMKSVRVDGVTKISRGTQLLLEFFPNLDRGMINSR